MREIIGNTTATPTPPADWNQKDATKVDYIKNKPNLGAISEKDIVEKADLAADVQESLNKANTAIQSVDGLATEDYVEEQISKIPTPDVSGQINTHDNNTTAHNDIRILLSELSTRLNTLADSDDTTLDQMSEIVAYIKANKSLIESITTNKVNVADIINNLTTNTTNKPLSAAQGVALKALIDALDTGKVSKDGNKVLSTNDFTDAYKSKVDSALQIETDPTVPAWAKASTKPSYSKSEVGLGNVDNVKQYSTSNEPPYPVRSVNGRTGDINLTATDVGALPADTVIPDSLSDLTDDATHRTVTDEEKVSWNNKATTEYVDNSLSDVARIDETDDEEINEAEITAYITAELQRAKDSGEFDGKSAYEYAQDKGYTGTEVEFAAKLATPFVTPQMFGAKADGVTNDTEAFKDAVATGEILYIPKGNYYLSEQLSYYDLENVKIICDGSIYMESQEKSTFLFVIVDCKNVEISGLKVESTRDKIGEAPEGHTRIDYSSSNVDPIYIRNCDYVNIRDCVFINPNYGFMIRGVLDDKAEVKTKAVIDNVTIKNACMGCYVDRLLEFNITNSTFYMATGMGIGDHAIYTSRYIEKVNIDSCYFWSEETDANIEMGPLVEFGAFNGKCIQNANISNCVFSTRIPFDIRGDGKYTISDCIAKTYGYFARPCGSVDVTITNCQIDSNGGVISPSSADKSFMYEPMKIFIDNSIIKADSLFPYFTMPEVEVDLTVNACEINTTNIAVYSSVSPTTFRFVNSKFTVLNETSFVRYYHANEMEFVGCKISSVKGLFTHDTILQENNVTLINCFLEAPSMYRGGNPIKNTACFNSYLNGELIDKPYVTLEEMEHYVQETDKDIVLKSPRGNEFKLCVKDSGYVTTKVLKENLVVTSIDTDGSIYEGNGYLADHRLNSSNEIVESAAAIVSGYIPFSHGNIIEAVGTSLSNAGQGGNYIAFYDMNFNLVHQGTFTTAVTVYQAVWEEKTDGVYGITIYTNNPTVDISNAKYFRISFGICSADKFVVTIQSDDNTTQIVESVNGKTGQVILTSDDVGAQPRIYTTPQMYGAKGDGVTDDTSAFENALAEHGHVFVPRGDYLITRPLDLTYKKSLFSDDGQNPTIIYAGDESSSVVLIGRLAIFKNINIQILTTPYKGVVFDTNNLNMKSVTNGKNSRVEHVKVSFNHECQEATLIGITVDSGTDANNMPICTGDCYQVFNDIVVDGDVYYGTGIKMTLIQGRAFTEETKLGFPWLTHISYNDIYLGCPYTAIKAGVENTSGSAYFKRIRMDHILFNNVSSQSIDSASTRYFLDVNSISAFLSKCIGWDYHHTVDDMGNILKANIIGERTNLSFTDTDAFFGNELLQSCDFTAEIDSEFTVEENPAYFMDKYFKGTFLREGYDSVDVKINSKLTDSHIGDVAEEKINEILYSGYTNLLEHPLTQFKKDYRFSDSGQKWVYEQSMLTIIIPIVKGGNIIRWLSDICELNYSYESMFFFNDDALTKGTFIAEYSNGILIENDTDRYLDVPNPSGYKYVSIPFRYKGDVDAGNMVITINQAITGGNVDSYTKYLQDNVIPITVAKEVERTAQPKGDYALESNAETWTFTLADGSTVTKKVVLA